MECSPLQPLEESCRSLKREWEGMLQNAETVFSDAFSSLKCREKALTAERAEVHSLVLEIGSLRHSLSRRLHNEENQSFEERDLAKQISKNVCNQFTQVKEMQNHIASQLIKLKSQLRCLENQKLDVTSRKTVVSSSIQNADDSRDVKVSTMERNIEVSVPLSGSSPIFPVSNVRSVHLDIIRNTDNNIAKEKESETRKSRVKVNSMVIKEEPQDESPCMEKYIDSKGAKEDMDLIDHDPLSKRLSLFRQNIDYRWNHTKEEIHDGSTYAMECYNNKLHKLVERENEMHSTKRSRGSETLLPASKKEVPIEIALQEDAPGLLEKLEEKGLLEDMVMYCACCDDDWSETADQFKDLECVSSKVWGAPSGLIKFAQPQTLRHNASSLGKAPTYCLSCLVFLIEQTKSLRHRGWPVEWGWCRQLQTFLFVFDKHNRIILERPEYGNATYFFELVESLPVTWQVMRLIKVLSVIPLSKTSILENRPLQVGFELTSDESRVLEGYGWTPNTGLGTFLNFCDRVYHDVKDEDNHEWRQKLGKCLMDGYDKGRITMQCNPVVSIHSAHEENDEDIKPNIADIKPNLASI